MSSIKGNAVIILSRDAVTKFFEDELLPYGPFAKHTVDYVSVNGTDNAQFLKLHLKLPDPVKTTVTKATSK